MSVDGAGWRVNFIDISGCRSVSCNIRSASCFDKAAALAGIGRLDIWLWTFWELSFWFTYLSGNNGGIAPEVGLSLVFTDDLVSLFCLLIRAATKKLTSFWFISGTSFRRRAESDWCGEVAILEGSDVLVSNRVASASSLVRLWVPPPFIASMVEIDLFLERWEIDSREDDRLALSAIGLVRFFIFSFTIIKGEAWKFQINFILKTDIIDFFMNRSLKARVLLPKSLLFEVKEQNCPWQTLNWPWQLFFELTVKYPTCPWPFWKKWRIFWACPW